MNIFRWKGVPYNLDEDNRAIELYNLETDPGETENIAGQHPEITEEIRKLMKTSREPSPLFDFPLDG